MPRRSPKYRIVCFAPYPEEGPSVRHRIYGYRDLFAENGIEIDLYSFMTKPFYRIRKNFGIAATVLKSLWFAYSACRLALRILRVPKYDAVIIHREVFPLGKPYFERLVAKLNKLVIYDIDDAIWHKPTFEVNQRKMFWCDSKVSDIIAHSSAVVAGNRYICDYASRYNNKVFRIPTAYKNVALGSGCRFEPEKPIIVWIGNLGNAEYLHALMPVLERLGSRQNFILRLIGGSDMFDVDSDKFPIERLRWSEEREDEWLGESDIGIMPLYDRPYELGKCSFKIIQYFSACLPVVASPVGMNSEVIINGVNGYLATNEDEWFDALEFLIRNPEKRKELGFNGRSLYMSQFTCNVNVQRWMNVLASLAPQVDFGMNYGHEKNDGV